MKMMGQCNEMSLVIEMDDRLPTSPTSALSEANLQIHNAACPKGDGYFQVNLIREERARAVEHDTYRRLFGHIDALGDADFCPRDTDIALRRQASLEALKLYGGSFASHSTPMDRFMALSPTQDTQPWLARRVMDESGIASGDLEALDVRRLASEMANAEPDSDDTRQASIGSPTPSSDTLSVSRLRVIRRERREANGTRSWKRIGMRRRSTLDRTKVLKPAQTTCHQSQHKEAGLESFRAVGRDPPESSGVPNSSAWVDSGVH